ncbi:MAG: Ig-like domain-containing protein [Bacteroidetes bacterium]|nr:Ig-like domain-containing protein [Bacteroidota bacterium]
MNLSYHQINKRLVEYALGIIFLLALVLSSCKKDPSGSAAAFDLDSCWVGNVQLQLAAEVTGVPLNQDIRLVFSSAVDTALAVKYIYLKDQYGSVISGTHMSFTNSYKTILIKHTQNLAKSSHYSIEITALFKGNSNQSFKRTEFKFVTTSGVFTLKSIILEGQDFRTNPKIWNVKRQGAILEMEFSESLDTAKIANKFTLASNAVFDVTLSNNNKSVHLVCKPELEGYKHYTFSISPALRSVLGNSFAGFSNTFITALDSTLKFQQISDDELLTLVQQQTFRYFYDFGHPGSGMARERNTSGDIVTTGGSGFGVMALIVGMERGFITRSEGVTRLAKIIGFLETCDRFHGAWSHWINGSNGHVVPFGDQDNGGDLVETAYMAQGLITMRQYLDPSSSVENDLINRINALYNGIEWDWYRQGSQNVLYWHWSPSYGWAMNFKIQGYNETLITYIMAAASTTHTIPAIVYKTGFARNGGIINGKSFYNYVLPVGYDYGGPLFFAHYSFLGLDPRNLSDAYANYWTQNVNHSLINWAYCKDNPKKWPDYSEHCWGLTASDIPNGYAASEPTNDLGVITPTAAISSLPYTSEQSMKAIRFFYYILGDKLWGSYGFYDAFDVHSGWWADSYLAIDQGPEICMIENYRSGLLWNLFMSAPEVQAGLTKLGFTYSKKK